MARSKYNVDKDIEARTLDGITFDSALEMKYYRDVLLPCVESGEIVRWERQKKYELQPGFVRKGKKVLPVTYVADFYMEYADGRTEVIDIKGVPDAKAVIKRKMFWFRYPDMEYNWISFSKKWGGWINYDELVKLRKEEKLRKKKKESLSDGKEE